VLERIIKANGSLRSFRYRNYRILFPANALSNIGTWTQRVAQDWLVLQLTHSGRDLGLVTGLQFLPSLLLSLYGGSLADRFNKRILLYFTNLGGGISAGILGVLVMIHEVRIWHVYVLALGLGISSAIDAPIRQSFTSEMVGKSDLANAVSLNSANFNAGRLVGPGLSGLLIAWFGTGPSFLINAASYIAVMIALYAIREEELHIEAAPQSGAKMSQAFAYVRARKDIQAVMITIFFAATFGLNFQIFTALMATSVFHRGAASYGSLGSIVAIGSLSGALIAAKLDKRRSPRFIAAFATIFGSFVLISSFMPSYLTYALSLPFCGGAALTTMIAANSYLQTSTDPAIRGRVMGIYLLIFMGGAPFGSPLIGWLCTVIGTRETIAMCGVITLLAAILVYSRYRHQLHTPKSVAVGDVLAFYENK
jgi:MFS family permease